MAERPRSFEHNPDDIRKIEAQRALIDFMSAKIQGNSSDKQAQIFTNKLDELMSIIDQQEQTIVGLEKELELFTRKKVRYSITGDPNTPYIFDIDKKGITHPNKSVWKLTPLMFRVLSILIQHAPNEIEHEIFIQKIWGTDILDHPEKRSLLWVNMSRLRTFLEGVDPQLKNYLQNSSGFAYGWTGTVEIIEEDNDSTK